MSFFGYKDIIEEGDFVLAFISRNDIKPITVTKNEILNTRYGHFLHNDMIGLPYGKQMAGAKGYGFIHLLHPTPEMWTISLPHRTQIVYTHDSSYIMQRLNVISGTRVIEAGTGSGSFTHSFSRSVGKEGKVFTYEFHQPRYEEAKKEITKHGIDANTFITHRDVCQDGFEIDVPSEFQLNSENKVNAQVVFLDLPSPWIAINNLDKVIDPLFKVGICCFSPCIEQVHKTVESLQENGWIDIEMVECSSKRWEARKDMVRDVNDVIKRLKDIQSRRSNGIEGRKRIKLEQSNDEEINDNDKQIPQGFNPFGKGSRVKEGDVNYNWTNVTKVETEIKTHTSYLTFAFKVPPKYT